MSCIKIRDLIYWTKYFDKNINNYFRSNLNDYEDCWKNVVDIVKKKLNSQ